MTRVTESKEKVKNVFCAIDVHQESMLAGIALDRGKPSFMNCDTDEDGMFQLVEYLIDLAGRHPGSEIRVVYEASGCGFRLADLLIDHGIWAAVLSPTHLPQTVKTRKNKTDKNDCIRLLDMIRSHVLAGAELPAVWIPPAQVRDDREIVRRRLSLKERGADVKNAILGLLRRYGIKKPDDFKNNWTKKHVAWLKSLVKELDHGAGVQLDSLLRELEFFDGECERMDQEVDALGSEDRYRDKREALIQIKGVSDLTAMVFLTELGDLSRFSNRRQLGNYLGLTPRVWESGEQNDRKGKISKMGPARVRKVLNQAAWSAVLWSPYWRDWFDERAPKDKKTNKRKYGKKFIVAVMRKLGIEMWHVALAA